MLHQMNSAQQKTALKQRPASSINVRPCRSHRTVVRASAQDQEGGESHSEKPAPCCRRKQFCSKSRQHTPSCLSVAGSALQRRELLGAVATLAAYVAAAPAFADGAVVAAPAAVDLSSKVGIQCMQAHTHCTSTLTTRALGVADVPLPCATHRSSVFPLRLCVYTVSLYACGRRGMGVHARSGFGSSQHQMRA